MAPAPLPTYRSLARANPIIGLAVIAMLGACGYSESELADPEVVAEVERQQALAKATLAELASGAPAPALPGGGASLVGKVSPLMIIPLNPTAGDYEARLLATVREALIRKPSAVFDLVSVAPPGASEMARAASDETIAVYETLIGETLPQDRLSLAAVARPEVEGAAVHVYVR